MDKISTEKIAEIFANSQTITFAKHMRRASDKELFDEVARGINEHFDHLSTPPQSEDDGRDAERYRWLRDYKHDLPADVLRAVEEGSETMDAAIDAAIAAEKGE